MGFVQQKNTPLTDRRFARSVAEYERQRAAVSKSLFGWLLSHAQSLIGATDAIAERAMRSFDRRFKRQYGLAGTLHRPNGERECARRRRQIARGTLTRANGLYIGEIKANRLVDL